MSDHIERSCSKCGSLLHHESKCEPVEVYTPPKLQYPMLWAIHEACKKLGH